MSTELLIAIIGFVGVLGGGVLQYALTRLADRRRERREQLLSAYSRLSTSVHRLASAQKSRTGVNEAQTEFEMAKAQFLLHGSSSAVKLFANWLSEFGVLNSIESQRKFSQLINQMRSDCSDSTTGIEDIDVQRILFPAERA